MEPLPAVHSRFWLLTWGFLLTTEEFVAETALKWFPQKAHSIYIRRYLLPFKYLLGKLIAESIAVPRDDVVGISLVLGLQFVQNAHNFSMGKLTFPKLMVLIKLNILTLDSFSGLWTLFEYAC